MTKTGEVISLGKHIPIEWLGKRVVINPILYCGECKQCTSNHTNRCLNRRFIGGDVDGAMAERIVVPIKNLLPLPENLSFEKGVLTEPFAVGLRAVKRAGDLEGKTVLVIGCGPIGLLTMVAAIRAGAKLIVVTDIVEKRCELAMRFGADAALDPSIDNFSKTLTSATGASGIDVTFDTVGIQATFDQAANMVKRGGIVVAIAGWQTMMVDFSVLVTRELTLLGTFNYTEEFELALNLLVDDSIGLNHIITHSYPLSRGAEAFALLEKQRGNFGKVVLTI